MPTVVFSKAAGQVSSFIDPTLPARVTLNIQNWGGFLGFKSIISRVTVSSRGNFQFLHTLGGQVFVYVFGDRIGRMGISGLSFDAICGDEAGTLGVERVLNYYNQNRIAARSIPLRVSIGTATTLSGYLVGLNTEVIDPKSRIWQFNMELALIPVDDIDEDRCDTSGFLSTVDDDEDSKDSSLEKPPTNFPDLDDDPGSDNYPESDNYPGDTGGQTLKQYNLSYLDGGYAPSVGPNLNMIKAVAG